MLVEFLSLADSAAREILACVPASDKAIIIFAGRFTGEIDQRDGYFQRVRAIDNLLSSHTRIYVDTSGTTRKTPAVRKLAERSILISTAGSRLREMAVARLAQQAGSVYVHSLLGARARMLRKIFRTPPRVLVWDVHGAAPEEAAFRGESKLARKLDALERQMAGAATQIVTVSDAMARHIQAKHLNASSRYITMPAAPLPAKGQVTERELSFVYSGSTQGWQGFPAMAAAIAETPLFTPVTLLIADSDQDDATLKRLAADLRVTIDSDTPDGVRRRLPSFAYGFCLRENHILNRVACPTKLLDYLEADVVPVLSFTGIGDFHSLGLRYLPLDTFVAGVLPKETERLRMVRENRAVLEKLNRKLVDGSALLLSALT